MLIHTTVLCKNNYQWENTIKKWKEASHLWQQNKWNRTKEPKKIEKTSMNNLSENLKLYKENFKTPWKDLKGRLDDIIFEV